MEFSDRDKVFWGRFKAKIDNQEEALRAFMRWKCETDLYFLAEFLGMDKAKSKDGRRSRLDPKLHGWMCERLQKPQSQWFFFPRDHAKSTLLKLRLVQIFLQNPNTRIALISRTAGLTRDQLADIKIHLRNPELMELYPDLIPDPGEYDNGWVESTRSTLIVKWLEGEKPPQGKQFEAFGVGATVTGKHFDVMAFDDIINEESVSTPEQLSKVEMFFALTKPLLDPEGIMYGVGTRYHIEDIYSRILRDREYKTYVRAAVENGKPIYEFYTLKMLERIKRQMYIDTGSHYQFSCQYMNDPTPEESMIFRPPYLTYEKLPREQYDFYITCDPAATAKKESDETAIAVVAVNRIKQVYVVEAEGYKVPPDEAATILVEKIAKYRPKKVGVELGPQAAFAFIFETKRGEWERLNRERLYFTFEEIKTGGVNKTQRINATLGAFVRDGRVYFKPNLDKLFKQMSLFTWDTDTQDDVIDALSMQIQLIDDFKDRAPIKTLTRPVHGMMALHKRLKKKRTWEEINGLVQ